MATPHRLQTILYELSSAAFYLARIDGEEAAALRVEVLALVERCKAMAETMAVREDEG